MLDDLASEHVAANTELTESKLRGQSCVLLDAQRNVDEQQRALDDLATELDAAMHAGQLAVSNKQMPT